MTWLRTKTLAHREDDANKYSHGTVGVIAGSTQYPGAAVLTVGGARRGGAGYIQYADLAELPTQLVMTAYPDVIKRKVKDISADSWVIGSGNPVLIRTFNLPKSTFLVLDAESISLVKKSRSIFTIITPHHGEFARLGYDLTDSSLWKVHALQAANHLNAYVVLKGAKTLIASPDGLFLSGHFGTPALATAGTGDVLAGFIASMLASWKPETSEEVMGVIQRSVKAHGRAARRASRRIKPLTAPDLLAELPKSLR